MQDVYKRNDEFILGPLNLEIPVGFITALVGLNGSGKSTIMRMLINQAKPDKGLIQIWEHRYPEDEVLLKQRVGYMPDTYEMLDESMTPQQMIDYIHPFYPQWDLACTERLLHKFKIDKHKKFRKMTKGMLQKYNFVQTLSQSPDLLLLDEPSSGLDPLSWRDMMDEIGEYMENGQRTVFIATHIIEEVRRIADYVVFTHDGQILGMYEKDQLLENWKELWIEGEHIGLSREPGIYYVDEHQPNRVIVNDYATAMERLQRLGVTVYRTQPVPLEEILEYMIKP